MMLLAHGIAGSMEQDSATAEHQQRQRQRQLQFQLQLQNPDEMNETR